MLLREFGPPDRLCLEDVPRPEPAAGEVLVRVHAAGVHALDCATRAGAGPGVTRGDLPIIPGRELSGVVEAVGAGGTRFRPGDRVYGLLRSPAPGGAYAEYAAVPEEELAFKPRNLSHAEAATLPLDALAIRQALDTLGLAGGQTLLIHPAAGAVRALAAQLAAVRGLRVDGTLTSPPPGGADGVLVTGGTPGASALRALRPGGGVVSLFGDAPHPHLLGVYAASPHAQPAAAPLEHLSLLVEQGQVSCFLDATFPLEAAARAHRRQEAHPASGRIALSLVRRVVGGVPDQPSGPQE